MYFASTCAHVCILFNFLVLYFLCIKIYFLPVVIISLYVFLWIYLSHRIWIPTRFCLVNVSYLLHSIDRIYIGNYRTCQLYILLIVFVNIFYYKMMHMISIASYHLFFIYSILVDCISLFAVLVCCLFTEYVNKESWSWIDIQ